MIYVILFNIETIQVYANSLIYKHVVSPDFYPFRNFLQPNICIYDIYNFCVEVFEKTISRTEMIDHSFES